MAYGVVHYFPGGTKEQYEVSTKAVHPGRESLPDGQIYHAAGRSPQELRNPTPALIYRLHMILSSVL